MVNYNTVLAICFLSTRRTNSAETRNLTFYSVEKLVNANHTLKGFFHKITHSAKDSKYFV